MGLWQKAKVAFYPACAGVAALGAVVSGIHLSHTKAYHEKVNAQFGKAPKVAYELPEDFCELEQLVHTGDSYVVTYQDKEGNLHTRKYETADGVRWILHGQ